MIPNPGEQFRQFRILSKAGEGGMGVVLRAHDTRLGRDVALKFLTRIGSVDPGEADRLRLEGRSLAALNHRNIVTIHDLDEADGAPFLVLEWVPGASLAQAPVSRPCGEAEFLRLALPIAEGLAAAHSRGIVHRDLKPGNVLVTEDGVVKLADFGLAKFRDANLDLTRSAAIVGTVAYMSPEQATGDEVGPRSDVFSFGVLAYELLTGSRPFDGNSITSVMYGIVNAPHVPLASARPDLSAVVLELVERCLQKRPEDRFSSGAELAQEVQRAIRGHAAAETRQLGARPRGLVAAATGSPEIRYCRTADGASLAYSVHGSGPVIVRVLGWFTHLEMEWEWPALRLIWERLGETHTVVRYDGRGIGLSSPWTEPFTEATRQADLDAVLNAVGAERVVLYGISEGGWTAAHYTAAHPERVSHLVIYGSYARGARFRPGYDAEETKALETLMRKGWGRDTPQYRQIFTTAYFGSDADPGLVAHFNQLQRAAADGDTAARYQESLHERGDGRPTLATIRTPTLVVHCRDDQIIPFEEGRVIASVIPGAQFLPLPTGTHYFPTDDEVTERMSEAIARFTRS
jgi:pimeloyl-ACP methyl ester carboxylesterase